MQLISMEPDSRKDADLGSHRDEDGGQVGGRRRIARLADAGQVEGVPQGLVQLERPVQLHLQRVVRAELHVLILRQVAPAQPDGLTCQVTNTAGFCAAEKTMLGQQ